MAQDLDGVPFAQVLLVPERVIAILEDLKQIAYEAERAGTNVFFAVGTSIDVYVQQLEQGIIPTTLAEDSADKEK